MAGAPPVLKHLCETFVELAAPMELGDAPKGRRRIIPIIGGRVEGEPVDPARYVMRTHPRFKTGGPRYVWLNRMIAIGSGAREPASVRVSVFEVL